MGLLKLFNSYTPVYYWNRDSKKRFVVNQGGTSSSKTWSIDQVLAKKCLEEICIITVVAKTANSLERGALRDFKNLLKESELLRFMIQDPSLVRGPYRFKNGSELEFVNLNDPQTARHGKRQYLFLNEANTIDYEAARQLMVRTTKQVFIDYNPDSKFWVHDEIITRKDCDYFISNFTHNQWCSEQTIEDLYDYKQRWQDSIVRDHTGKITEQNTFWRNKWYVYGLGITGIVEGVIFESVDYINHLPMGLFKRSYALDFGFKNDPSAMSLIGMKRGGNVFAKELIYERGLTTPDLMKRFKSFGITKKDLIIADSSNPDAIAQMQRAGYNIVPAVKGPGSIKTGIAALQALNIYLTQDSVNWKTEQARYKYKNKNGVWLNEPIDKWNHLWDGMRYWYQYHFPRKVKKKARQPRKIKIINREV